MGGLWLPVLGHNLLRVVPLYNSPIPLWRFIQVWFYYYWCFLFNTRGRFVVLNAGQTFKEIVETRSIQAVFLQQNVLILTTILRSCATKFPNISMGVTSL